MWCEQIIVDIILIIYYIINVKRVSGAGRDSRMWLTLFFVAPLQSYDQFYTILLF